jgi:hypothetical protein
MLKTDKLHIKYVKKYTNTLKSVCYYNIGIKSIRVGEFQKIFKNKIIIKVFIKKCLIKN